MPAGTSVSYLGISTTSRHFCMTFIGWRCRRESPTGWPWLSIGAYMAWHCRICAMACSMSQNWIGAGCVLQCPTPLSFRQPDSLLSVTVPFRSPIVDGTVCQLTSRQITLPVFCARLNTYLFSVSFPAWLALFNLHSPSACINLRHLKYFNVM